MSQTVTGGSGGGGGATLLPSIPSTKFLCHFDGAGSSFVNNGFSQSLSFKVVSPATQTTAQAKFGPASLLCTGNPSQGGIYIDNSGGEIALGTGAWTWECWFFPNSFAIYDAIICGANTGDYQGPIIILVGGALYAYASSNGSGWTYNITTSYSPNVGAWNHVALVADGQGNMSLYANGSRVGTTSVGNIFCSNNIWLGHYPYFPGGTRTTDGYIDEVRLSSVAQYSGPTYTVPTAPFADGQAIFPVGAPAGTLGYCQGYLFTCLGSGVWQANVQNQYGA